MVQHPAAIDVIERSQARPRQVQQRHRLPNHRQSPRLRPRPRDRLCRRGPIQMSHPARPPIASELLGQHDRAIAGAPAGHQRTQPGASRSGGPEYPVVDLAQMTRAADHQPLGLVSRVPLRIGVGLILLGEMSIGRIDIIGRIGAVGCVDHAERIRRPDASCQTTAPNGARLLRHRSRRRVEIRQCRRPAPHRARLQRLVLLHHRRRLRLPRRPPLRHGRHPLARPALAVRDGRRPSPCPANAPSSASSCSTMRSTYPPSATR